MGSVAVDSVEFHFGVDLAHQQVDLQPGKVQHFLDSCNIPQRPEFSLFEKVMLDAVLVLGNHQIVTQ